jgi:hypothetical protein
MSEFVYVITNSEEDLPEIKVSNTIEEVEKHYKFRRYN